VCGTRVAVGSPIAGFSSARLCDAFWMLRSHDTSTVGLPVPVTAGACRPRTRRVGACRVPPHTVTDRATPERRRGAALALLCHALRRFRPVTHMCSFQLHHTRNKHTTRAQPQDRAHTACTSHDTAVCRCAAHLSNFEITGGWQNVIGAVRHAVRAIVRYTTTAQGARPLARSPN